MNLKKKTPSGGNREGAKQYCQPQYNNPSHCVQANFKEALKAAGLHTKDNLLGDGRLRRIHIEGDRHGSKNGWYVLYGGAPAAGAFGCWKRGISESWCVKPERELTQAQREQNRLRMIEAQKAREAEEIERRRAARDKALLIWKRTPLAPDSYPYLMKKTVRNHGLHLYNGALVIPVRDSTGMLHSLQFIDEDGNKRFLSGGRKNGCYFPIGRLVDSLCIAEGYATAASVYESTGLPVVVAFDAGNLLSVAQALRAKFPCIKITLCADNDENTPGNPGLTKAREAAAAIGAFLAVPPCAGDFNDFLKGAVQ